MRRALLLVLAAVLLVAPVLSQTSQVPTLSIKKDATPPWLFRGLQIQFTALSWADYTMTSWALASGQYGEANPLARWYVNKPYMAIPILAVMDLLVHWGLDSIYKDSKTTAWALLIAFNVARAYVLYHNLRVAQGATR